jgi:subtilisin family serine protease
MNAGMTGISDTTGGDAGREGGQTMKRLLVFLVLAAAMAMLLAAPAGAAQGGKDVYIVIMKAKPAVAYAGGVKDFRATRPAPGKNINADSARVNRYEKYLKTRHNRALRGVGVVPGKKIHDYTIALNGFAVPLTKAQAAAIARQPGVVMVLRDQMRYKTTDNSPTFLGLNSLAGPWAAGYTGEGVVVGVIDTGIWPEHPSFADDGTYMPMPRFSNLPYEFGNTAQNPNDAPYTEQNNKLLGARQILDTYRYYIGADADEFDSARDDDGHGTHTASTAAGNSDVEASISGVSFGTVSGIAPRARIVAYKALGNLGGFSSDLAAAIDQAVADGVDVINYSIGGGAGSPGADDIAFLFAADAGVYVATSAGNEGPGPATVGNPATMPWVTTVGANTQDRTFEGHVTLGDGSVYRGASITAGSDVAPIVDAADLGNELADPAVGFDPADVEGKIVLVKRGIYARVEKGYAVAQAGGAGMILYNTSDADDLNTDTHWLPALHVNNTDGLAIKAYIAANPGSATAQISGGVYTVTEAPWMASFSSRGPNPVAPDIIKPDVTAPGVNILAGASPFPDLGFVPGELFQSIGGTSMSSPHVAGVFALVKQAHPEWSAAAARSAVMTTADRDVKAEGGIDQAGPFAMGSGQVKPDSIAHGSMFAPGVVYDAGWNDYLGFICDVAPELLADPDATRAALERKGVPTQAYNLNYPSIGVAELPGSITIRRKLTNVAGRALFLKPQVQAPDGYSVDVSPSTLLVPVGTTASYTVTITNESAPVGEWRYGSLTWVTESTKRAKKTVFAVYSPIAVKASELKAPSVIAGSGESGSASFDVTFGYAGSYTAAAHGLVPATVTSATVLQDPDQTFDPGDGFSNLHTFDLSGAAFFRIALPPEAAEADSDLDVFVFGPNGEEYSSTSGGTDELIDVVLPADGTWKVYVHGWQAVGADSDYDLYTWAVSATPGGNLTIDSAPVSATLGATEPVNVSWTGATAGQWHLGAVSHTGPLGLMGLTVVNVDNR